MTWLCFGHRSKTVLAAYCIRVCPFVSEWVCASQKLWTPYLKNRWREFHPVLLTDLYMGSLMCLWSFDLINVSQAQVRTWPNCDEIISNGYRDIVFTRFSCHCRLRLWPLTYWSQNLISTSKRAQYDWSLSPVGELMFLKCTMSKNKINNSILAKNTFQQKRSSPAYQLISEHLAISFKRLAN